MAKQRFQGIRHVQKNSGVTASNTSQSTRELEARTNELQSQLDASAAGMLLQWELRKVAPAVVEGTAVFWNAVTSQFEPAQAGAENDTATGIYVATAASDVLGVCLHKEDNTTGTVIFAGFAEMSPTQVANLFGAAASPGRYYLSAVNAGKLTKQRPSVTVAVAYLIGPADACDINSWVYILPQHRNFLEDHVHFQLDLTALPAGEHTPPETGDPHVITSADAALKGWLPADHSSFSSTAPAGAVFGYNIAADAALSAVWPPMPPGSAILEILRPTPDEISGFVRVSADFVRIDLHGIWWMSDCYNQVPWDTAYDSTATGSSSSAAACPVSPPVRLTIAFIRMLAITNKTVVTSLQPAAGEPLKFLDANGEPATTGDLYAQLNLSLLISDTEEYGGQTLKDIATDASQFKRGWVTEGLISGSASVALTSTHSRALDPEAVVSDTNPRVHQGIITVDFTADSTARELQPQLTKLTDTLEREHKGVLFLGFPPSRTSSAKFSIVVPDSGLPSGDLQLHMRTLVFGRASGPLPEITMTYTKVSRPTLNTPTALATAQTAFDYDVTTPSSDTDGSGTDLLVDNVIEVDSAAFSVVAGDTVFVTVQRAANASPTLAADFGLLRIVGIVSREV